MKFTQLFKFEPYEDRVKYFTKETYLNNIFRHSDKTLQFLRVTAKIFLKYGILEISNITNNKRCKHYKLTPKGLELLDLYYKKQQILNSLELERGKNDGRI